MAGNTIMTAKNTFGDGLIMDFAPDNTQATCLTHALNATLLTMNGNELSLQNDMGNGRVETAYLPEGYIPVGTCEFGDIIYIVSYNPITNKSQIGCFPSPERNISSEELSGVKTQFNLDEFTKSNTFGFKETISNSIKKVIYDNSLNPGDKFIVHSGDIHDNMSRISDYGNESHIVGAFPKQFKINVVAIEDSGKINYLNNDLKWYDNFYINQESTNNSNKPDIDSYRNLLSSGYSVFQSKVSGKLAILIELERIQTFNSTYEVLKSEETAEGKEITQTVSDSTNQETNTTVNYQPYDIYINFNWKTNNLDVNPKSIVIYDFKWTSNSGNDSKAGQYYVTGDKEAKVAPLPEISKTDETKKYIELEIKGQASTNDYDSFLSSNYQTESDRYKGHTKITQSVQNGIPEEGKYYLDLHHIVDGKYYNNKGGELTAPTDVEDCIVNNYFKSSITKKGFTINIPDTDSKGNKIDKRDLILSFKVAPMMEYGVLSDLVQTHYIDFSKIGSGEINLEGYKYYIGENLCTLQIDSSIYPEDNKGVAEIEIQFYDNQGLCAKYFINNLVSYSGIITEYIPLNGNSSNYKLSKQNGKKLIPHAGQMFTNGVIPENVDTTLSYVYLDTKADKLKPVEVTYDKKRNIFYKIDDPNEQEVTINSTSPIFYNDVGTLYSNMLYAVKIIYKYTSKNVLGEYNTEGIEWDNFEWRWLWTNTMFNQYYYNVKDFKDNQFELTLDIGAQYYANFKTKDITGYEGPQNDTSDVFKGLGLNLSYVNNGEIQYTVDLGLQNTYNSFSLKEDSSDTGILSTSINVYSGNSYIQIQEDTQNNEYLKQSTDNTAPNNIGKKYEYIIKRQSNDMSNIANPWESKDAYKNYKPLFTGVLDKEEPLDTIEYVGNDSKSHNSSRGIKSNLTKLRTKQSLKINLVNPTLYIKTYISQATTHKEMINLIQKGYEEYGLTLEGNSFNFNYVYSLWANRSGDEGKDKQRYIVKWNQSKTLSNINEAAGDLDYFKKDDAKEKWDEINKMADKAELWQIRKAYGTAQHSIWKSSGDYFLREGKYDVNTSASFDLPNGFFINLLNFGTNYTYISKTNDTNNALRDGIFSDGGSFTDNTIYAQLAFNYGGDIHLLNDYVNISAGGNGTSLKTALQDLASKWAGWLANTYILNQSNIVSSLQLNELIYSNSVTTFTKDIVYCTKVESNNNQLLLNNYDYSKYLSQIQKHSNNVFNSNVTVQLNNITKNIPIQIQLKSLIPTRPQQSQNITIKSFANRTFDNVYISNISANNLYCIQNDTMIPINNNQEVYALTSYSKSDATFSKDACKFSIPKTFIYQDESLVPKKSSPAGIQLYSQKFVGSGWGGTIGDLLISDTILADAKHVK